MKLGSNDISAVKIGSTDVNKVYIGSTEVWSSFTGLLDTYTGAAAAYSLRQLKSGVTNAIEVRIDTTGQPTYDIGFVNGELDTTTLEGYCTGGLDAYVTTWYDQSGNGNDAEQTTAASQPQIVSSGSVITENGKPALDFDGSDDYFISTAFSINLSSGFSGFVVNVYQSVNNHRLFSMSTSPNPDFALGGLTMSTRQFFIDSDPSITISLNGDGTQDLNTFISTNNTATYYRDNSSEGSDSFSKTNTITPDTATIGIRSDDLTSSALGGLLQELILYPSDQSSNRSGIETNINDFYDIY